MRKSKLGLPFHTAVEAFGFTDVIETIERTKKGEFTDDTWSRLNSQGFSDRGLLFRLENDVVEAYERLFNATRKERDERTTNTVNHVWVIDESSRSVTNDRFHFSSPYGFIPKQKTDVIFGSGNIILNHYEFEAINPFRCSDFHSVFFTGIESLFRQWPYLDINDLPSTIIGFGSPARFNAFDLSFVRMDDHTLRLSLKPLEGTNFKELAHRTFDLTDKFEYLKIID
eukprot:TRINITY_DN68319_c0_g1_i1.p1 TRINITY_DN68319_c0_g1~~TRINITY_DN68319_c0_g1_i1.p1  ORF type:complete len:227 (+),score=28.37 TRINITY_DN68319_c0_g1_i1:328-1008(+)